jgi:hypothetical protein
MFFYKVIDIKSTCWKITHADSKDLERLQFLDR